MKLGEFEELVLLVVCLLGDGAYGVSVLQAIEQHTGRRVSISAVHAALYRMERKGLLASQLGEATAQRAHRPRRYFVATGAGKETLRETRDVRMRLWQLIPEARLRLDVP